MNFKINILVSFDFGGYQICQKTADKISKICLHFKLKSKLDGRHKSKINSTLLFIVVALLESQSFDSEIHQN